MNAEELKRFRDAVQQRVSGAVYVPPAPVTAPERVPQRDFVACPSADAVDTMLPAAQEHTLSDVDTTHLRIILDPLVVHGQSMAASHLRALLTDAGYDIMSESTTNIMASSERAFAAQVNVFVQRAGDVDSDTVVKKYVLVGRFQQVK